METKNLPEKPYRGLEPFRYIDRNIFSGRDNEIDRLYNMLLLYRGIIMYGESGTGKSSLVGAGLANKLIESGEFTQEIIRLNPQKESTFIVQRIENPEAGKNFLPTVFPIDPNKPDDKEIHLSFDKFIEVVQNFKNHKEYIKQTPVLIFDQFEELITQFEEAVQDEDATQKENKSKLQKRIFELFDKLYFDAELPVKLIFIFREDYLAKFSPLFKKIPDLRNHVLRIKPIKTTEIKNIISKPFEADNSNEPTFKNHFSESLITELDSQFKEKYNDLNLSLSDLQVVCLELYETNEGDRSRRLQNEKIAGILQNFYEKKLNQLSSEEKSIATDILPLLVLNDKVRNILPKPGIIKQLGKYSEIKINDVLTKLESTLRLIKKEKRNEVDYYEIVSESMIGFINKIKLEKEGKAKRRRNLIRWAIPISVIFIFLLIGYFYNYKVNLKTQEEKYYTAAFIAKKTNPTLAYQIARMGNEIYNSDANLINLLQDFKTNNIYYIIKAFKSPEDIVSANLSADNKKVMIVGTESCFILDTTGLLKRYYSFDDQIAASFFRDGKNYVLTKKFYKEFSDGEDAYSYNIKEINGQKISGPFIALDLGTDAISKEMRHLVINGRIYNDNDSLPEKNRQVYSGNYDKDLMSVIFSNNGKYIVAGYWGGSIYICNLKGNPLKIFGKMNNQVITSLAVTSDFKYIISGNHENTVQIWKVGDIDTTINPDLIVTITNPYKELKGHTGFVNCVAVSPDNKYILSGGNDNVAILWDTSGNQITVLRGHKSPVTFVNFSSDGKEMITATSDNQIFVWKKQKASELYKNNQMFRFSPWDYYSLGLPDYKLNKEDTARIKKLALTAFNYGLSLPAVNPYPEDSDYCHTLKKSITEINSLYLSLFKNPNFKDSILPANKYFLYKNFANLVFNDPVLLTGMARKESNSALVKRLSNYCEWYSKALLVDTTQVQEAISMVNNEYTTLTFYSRDSLKNTPKSLEYAKLGDDLIKAFYKKYPDNILLKECLIKSGANLSIAYLYSSKKDSAKIVAKRDTALIGKGLDMNELYKTEAYLFAGDYDRAKNCFEPIENLQHDNTTTFKKYLSIKLIKIKDKGLSTSEIDRFIEYLNN